MANKTVRVSLDFTYEDSADGDQYIQDIITLISATPNKSQLHSVTLPNGNIVIRNQINDYK